MVSRRLFLKRLSAAGLGLGMAPQLMAELNRIDGLKPIEGSWFEFQHHSTVEGKYWNSTLVNFTANQWDYKIREIAQSGIRYLVLLNTAIHDKSFYPSKLLPQHQMNCDEPLEVVLTVADKYRIRFFVSNGFYGEWTNPAFLMSNQSVEKLRLHAMNEIAEKYAHHKSFYGWYYPNETGIRGHYDEIFLDYVNSSSAEDEKYVRQLEQLDVDFIAYQDEIGAAKTTVEKSGAFFERLYRMHQKSAKSKLWADVEVFRFEGDVYRSALLPAPVERVAEQLKAVSPFVEKILIYQYIGLLNSNGTYSYAGHPDAYKLHEGLKKQGYLK